MQRINIFDTTLHDGEQSPGVNLASVKAYLNAVNRVLLIESREKQAAGNIQL